VVDNLPEFNEQDAGEFAIVELTFRTPLASTNIFF
jgi:hypothetical protein